MKNNTGEKLEMKIENDEITLERKDRCGCGAEIIREFKITKKELDLIFLKWRD